MPVSRRESATPVIRSRITVAALLVAVDLQLSPGSAAATPFSDLVILGQSLEDTGNVFAFTRAVPVFTGGPVPPSPPYFDGRFSNGPVYVDRVAAQLGLDATAWLRGGDNFAFGGARVTGSQPQPSLVRQARLVLLDAALRGGVDPGALFIVHGGGNDVRDAARLDDPAAAEAAVRRAAQAMGGLVSALARADATHIVVPTLPDVGRIPEQRAAGQAERARALTLAFNTALDGALDEAAAAFAIEPIRPDFFAAAEAVFAAPGSFGFANVTDPCLTGDPASDFDVCADPDAFVFWDDIHPTSAAHAVLADAVLDALTTAWLAAPAAASAGYVTAASASPAERVATVSEPAAVPLIASGLVALGLFWLRARPTRLVTADVA